MPRFPFIASLLGLAVLMALVASSLSVNAAEAPVRQGPAILKPGDQGVGRQVADLEFTDLDGKTYKLSDFGDRKAVVIALTGTGCPLCLKYASYPGGPRAGVS